MSYFGPLCRVVYLEACVVRLRYGCIGRFGLDNFVGFGISELKLIVLIPWGLNRP
jgi:hypothetical protein